MRAQRYSCPATPGGVESRESTAESVRLEVHRTRLVKGGQGCFPVLGCCHRLETRCSGLSNEISASERYLKPGTGMFLLFLQ